MRVSDSQKWQEWTDRNTDPYGRAVIAFAERWADAMEAAMGAGESLEACAARTCDEADTEGITGFQYGAAVVVLASSWEHGEQLRRWHNRDSQLGAEGEDANQHGGVLNPAALRIGRIG